MNVFVCLEEVERSHVKTNIFLQQGLYLVVMQRYFAVRVGLAETRRLLVLIDSINLTARFRYLILKICCLCSMLINLDTWA